VDWRRTVNDVLARSTGYELRRTPSRVAATAARRRRVGKLRVGDRLVEAPVFILCTLRSGSTLLRVLLDSHSEIHAPHELHLRYISVSLDRKWSERSMREMDLDQGGLEYLLWDRLLHRELASSGKRIIVDKTPNNVFIADRLKECWPDARFVFLLRQPAAIARSRRAILPEDADDEQNIDLIRRYCDALEAARRTHEGLTVRYEDVTADPAREAGRLCDFLGVRYEPDMVEYGRFAHGRYRSGLGDFADKIKTGQVQPADPPPEQVPEPLRAACAAWGYVDAAPAGATRDLAPS
jgi:Sulfotransferase family